MIPLLLPESVALQICSTTYSGSTACWEHAIMEATCPALPASITSVSLTPYLLLPLSWCLECTYSKFSVMLIYKLVSVWNKTLIQLLTLWPFLLSVVFISAFCNLSSQAHFRGKPCLLSFFSSLQTAPPCPRVFQDKLQALYLPAWNHGD